MAFRHLSPPSSELCRALQKEGVLLHKPGPRCCLPARGCESQESRLLGLPANFFSCRGSNVAKGLHFSSFLVQEFYQEEWGECVEVEGLGLQRGGEEQMEIRESVLSPQIH